MERSDRHTFAEVVLGHTLQYDIKLREHEAASAVVFAWEWHARQLGREFANRDLAIDWMAEWLDADTASQRLHHLSERDRREQADASRHPE